MYALLSLVSILTTWLYLQFSIKICHSYLRFALYVLVNILGTFTHIGFFFVLLGQVVFHYLFFRRTQTKKFTAAIALSLTPYIIVWAPILFGQISKSAEPLAWIRRPGLYDMIELSLLYGGTFWLLLPFLFYIWWRTGAEPFAAFSKLDKKRIPFWLLVISVGTPLLVSELRPIFNYRLAIIGVHLFALLTAAVIGRRAHYSVSVALVILTSIGLLFLHPSTATCDNRSIATYLNNNTKDDDMVIFTSLTRMPVDYYLQRSPTRKALFEISFPAEIDRHPGYEGNFGDPSKREALELEAEKLVNGLAARTRSASGSRVFSFNGPNSQINLILDEQLQKRFKLLKDQGLKCQEFSPYVSEIKVYEFSQ